MAAVFAEVLAAVPDGREADTFRAAGFAAFVAGDVDGDLTAVFAFGVGGLGVLADAAVFRVERAVAVLAAGAVRTGMVPPAREHAQIRCPRPERAETANLPKIE